MTWARVFLLSPTTVTRHGGMARYRRPAQPVHRQAASLPVRGFLDERPGPGGAVFAVPGLEGDFLGSQAGNSDGTLAS